MLCSIVFISVRVCEQPFFAGIDFTLRIQPCSFPCVLKLPYRTSHSSCNLARYVSAKVGSGICLCVCVFVFARAWRTVGSEYMAMPQVYATFCPVRDTDPDITLGELKTRLEGKKVAGGEHPLIIESWRQGDRRAAGPRVEHRRRSDFRLRTNSRPMR